MFSKFYRWLGMRTIGQYIAQSIYRYIWLILFSLAGLFFVFDLMAELADVGKADYTLRIAVIYALLQVPAHLYDIMPIATVAGAIVGLASLANNSEITVLRAAGMPPRALFKYLALLGIPLVLFTLVMGEWLQPMADQKAAFIRMKALGYSIGGELRSGIWLRDVQNPELSVPTSAQKSVKNITYININSVNAQGEAMGLRLWRFDDQGRLLQTVQADLGRYIATDATASPKANGYWRFEQARVQLLDADSGVNTRLETHAVWDWHTSLNKASLAGMQKLPERLHMLPLIQNILFLVRNDVDARKPISVLLRRLIHPAALWVMLALAMPFAYVRARGGAVASRVLAGVFMGIGFHTGNNLFQYLGLVQGWPLWLSAQMPVWIGLSLAIFLFWRFHRLH